MHQRIAHDKAITGFDTLVRADSQRNSVRDKTAEATEGRPGLRSNAGLKLTLLFFFALVLPLAAVSLAQTGDVTVQFNGGGADNKVYIGEENTLQIFIKNPGGAIVAMSLGFGFSSDVSGFYWRTPYGNRPIPGPYSPSTYVQEYYDAVNTFMDNGLSFNRLFLPDAFLIGGSSNSSTPSYLPAHATSTWLYDLKLFMPDNTGNYMGGFRIDNVFVPPAGAWIFDQGGGINYPPTFQGNGNTSSQNPDAPPVCFDIVHRGGFDIAFYGWPRRVGSDENVFFTGPTVGVSAWNWDFHDGSTHETVPNPIHSYSSTGVYTVSLEVTIGGGTQTITRTNYIQVNSVKADFTASPRQGSLDAHPGGLDVTFTDASTNAPTSWEWNFGDGSTHEMVQNPPTHTYTTVGVYNVSLTASNPGSSDKKTYLDCIHFYDVAKPDLEVSCYGRELVKKGFYKWLPIVVRNIGCAVASNAKLTLDLTGQPLLTFEVSAPSPNEPGPPYPAIVTWDLPPMPWTPLPIGSADYFLVTAGLYVDPGALTGAVIQTSPLVSPATGEVVLTNNTFTEHETVVAAIDPNDKSVQPRGCGSRRAIKGTERLNYLIQFENKPSATANAFYVLVVDTLNPNLDWGTLQVGPSSKDNVLTFDFDPTSGEMVWFFDGYDLPPNHNPPEGEGFVTFSVMPAPGLPDNTVISNRAHIRFDFENWLSAPATGPLQLSISNRDLNHNGIIDACEFICGNASGDGIVDISDVVYLIAYIFSGGSAPSPKLAGDANCDSIVDISDVVYLIAYIFSGGQAPCAGCK